MELRKAERADIRPLAELWTHAFPGRRTVADRVRQLETGIPPYGIDCSWVLEDGRRIAGAFRTYRMTQYLAGAALPMMGLAAVAVAPGYRRRGLGKRLVRDALRLAYERGDVVSVLYPFRPDFYRSLGWGLVGELHRYRFRPEALAEYAGGPAVHLADPGDRGAIARCYARVARSANGPIHRDDRAWTYHLDALGAHPFVYREGDEVRGYLLAVYSRAGSRARRALVVRELVAEDDVAYRALLGWIAEQRDQWPVVRYDARPDERFDLRLRDPRPPGHGAARALWDPAARILRGPMLRVVNVERALAARVEWGPEPGFGLTLSVQVEDQELPENRGPWHVTIEEGGARVRADGNGGADARLVTDAPTFAQIYAGELSPTAAQRLGRAAIDGARETLDRVFRPRSAFWLMDEF